MGDYFILLCAYAIWCLGSRVQILHSAEEHNLSPFDLNIACLCQSIEINNNKYAWVYGCRACDCIYMYVLVHRNIYIFHFKAKAIYVRFTQDYKLTLVSKRTRIFIKFPWRQIQVPFLGCFFNLLSRGAFLLQGDTRK